MTSFYKGKSIDDVILEGKESKQYKVFIRFIPQGTVNKNLIPDHLAAPKALDPKYIADNQPFDYTT